MDEKSTDIYIQVALHHANILLRGKLLFYFIIFKFQCDKIDVASKSLWTYETFTVNESRDCILPVLHDPMNVTWYSEELIYMCFPQFTCVHVIVRTFLGQILRDFILRLYLYLVSLRQGLSTDENYLGTARVGRYSLTFSVPHYPPSRCVPPHYKYHAGLNLPTFYNIMTIRNYSLNIQDEGCLRLFMPNASSTRQGRFWENYKSLISVHWEKCMF